MNTRMKDVNWSVTNDGVRVASVEHANLAVLMDIRDELKKLNALLHCSSFVGIPRALGRIIDNTTRKRKAVKA